MMKDDKSNQPSPIIQNYLIPFLLILSIGLLFYFGYFYRQVVMQLWPFMLLASAGILGGVGAYYHEQHYGEKPKKIDDNTLVMYVVFGICGAFSVPVLLVIFPISDNLKLENLLEGSTLSKPLLLCSIVVIVSFFGVKFLNKLGSSILGSIIESRVSKVESNVEFLGDFLDQSVDMIFRNEEKRILADLREFDEKIKEAKKKSNNKDLDDAVKNLDGYLRGLPKKFDEFDVFAKKYLEGRENADAKVGKMKYIHVALRLNYIESRFLLLKEIEADYLSAVEDLVKRFDSCISVLKMYKSWGLENDSDSTFLNKLSYAAVVSEKFPNNIDSQVNNLKDLIKENFSNHNDFLKRYKDNGGVGDGEKWEECFQT